MRPSLPLLAGVGLLLVGTLAIIPRDPAWVEAAASTATATFPSGWPLRFVAFSGEFRLAGFIDDPNASPSPSPSSSPNVSLPPPPPNTKRWSHPKGDVFIDFPAGFASYAPYPALASMVVLAASNSRTEVECDVIQVNNTQDPEYAWRSVAKAYLQASLKVTRTKSEPGEQGMFYFTGTSENGNYHYHWHCVGKPVSGGIIFVVVGVPTGMWDAEQGTLRRMLTSNVHFK